MLHVSWCTFVLLLTFYVIDYVPKPLQLGDTRTSEGHKKGQRIFKVLRMARLQKKTQNGRIVDTMIGPTES